MQTKGGEDLGISDIIAGFIQQELDQAGGALELQRADLAQRFNCVPSQINYVMSTRFSPEHGYIVESRRGGGGYIRITRGQVDRQTLLMHVINSIGDRLDAASARAIAQNLVQSEAVSHELGQALLSATRGTGIASSLSAGYAPWAGAIVTRQNGSMVSDRAGVATPYAMQRLQARGNFFVEPQSNVYEGQVVGINNKPDELDVNITLAKHMTNMRSSTADVLETLTPPIKMSLEESLDFANEDECVEVTPESIRVRKIILSREDWYKWRAKQRRQNNAQNNK
mgnify:CR=1 FL=1